MASMGRAEVLRLPQDGRRRPGEKFPDPRPYVAADLSRAVAMSGLSYRQIATVINRTCDINWVTPCMIRRWCRGEEMPLAHLGRVILWLAGSLGTNESLVVGN